MGTRIKTKPILIKADGTITEIMPKNGIRFSFEELYDILDCTLIESCELSDGRIMILDEEDKLMGDPQINRIASEMYAKGRKNPAESMSENTILITGGYSWDTIVNSVVVCERTEFY